jgi:spore maturation protein B
MAVLGTLAVPLILLAVAVHAMTRKVDVYGQLVKGAGEGLHVILRILPALVMLLTAIGMLRASGFLDWLTGYMEPLFYLLGIPAECAPLVLLRPFSGSGALAIGADIMREYGVDSVPGVTAAVMLGSTETTFYVMSVYLSGAGVSRAKYVLPVSLFADLVGMVTASLTVRLYT